RRLAGFRHVVEVSEKLVVILAGQRIILVVVALGTCHGQAEPRRRRDVYAIEDDDVPLLFLNRTPLAIEQVAPIEAGCHPLLQSWVWQQVAGELFDRELVERHVGVQGADYPIAPDILVIVPILLEAIAVGIAGGVEPRKRHALAVPGTALEARDDLFVGVGRSVGEKVIYFARAGRQAGQIEKETANE